ncbi:MAG TPA: amidohydrolase family protein [Vicinamibacterales bacterium]|nr:amidohydrolase family protein [Vicinamibacterales bacterium]
MTRIVLASLLATAALPFALRADAPNVYAIRGARVITAAGAPLDSATIVIRHGTIDAVGTNLTVPPDATVVDGSGTTVYPGLIDLGNTRAADQPSPQPPQNMRTTAELERWKRTQILKPQARAADAVKVDDAELTRLASAGITSALALPAGEVISGQSAFVNVVAPPDEPQIGNVVDARRGLIVVKPAVALHVSFPDRPRAAQNGYPESLMGVIAFVRQSFLDAQHYAELRAARGAVPHDAIGDDPAFDAMQPAIERRMPVAFEANEARQILRALKMAKELKLEPIVTGARHADEVAADLKSQNVRVIYSVNYPVRPRALAPDADEPLNALRERADAPKVPAALASAGIRFAFASAGASDPKDFVKNVGKAVKAGLSEDAAIRAMTISAATIAGVGDRLGSIEKGKLANLVVTDGSLFDEKTKITRVFVEGRPVSLDAVAPAPAGRGRGRGF